MLKNEPSDEQPTNSAREIARLKQEYEALSQQVKQLVKTESKLYAYQEKLDAQVKEYKGLYELSKKINTTFDVPKLFENTVSFVIHQLEYERVLILRYEESAGVYAVSALEGYYNDEERKKVTDLTLNQDDPVLAPFREGAEYLICKPDTEEASLAQNRGRLLMDEYLMYPLGARARPLALLAVGNSAGNAAFYRRVTDSEGALLGAGNLAGLLTSSLKNHIFFAGMEKALDLARLAEEKYRTLVDNIHMGVYRTDPVAPGQFLHANPAMAAMFGYDSVSSLMETRVSDIYRNPGDRKRLFEELRAKGTLKDVEVEMKKRDGTPIWTALTVTLVNNDETGGIKWVDGVMEDITERKKAREELQKIHNELEARVRERTRELSIANEQLHRRHVETSVLYQVSSVISRSLNMDDLVKSVLDTLSDLEVFTIDKGCIFVVEGDRMRIAGNVGHPKAFLDLHKDMKVGDCLCGIVAKTGEPLISGDSTHDSRHTMRNSHTAAHGHLAIPLKSKDRVEGVLDLYTPVDADIDENKVRLLLSIGNQLGIAIENVKLYEKTKELSLRDSLTGLWNHEEILRILGLELTRADREKSSVSVIMADLDFFKRVNDTYGHQAGDDVLRAAAGRMRSLFRSYDAVGRYGGEEFLIVLPGCDGKSAAGVAERLRRMIGSEGMDTAAGAIPVTMSLGVAGGGKEKKRDAKAQVHAADLALYRAKTNGRNRVEVASDEEEGT